MTDTNSSQAKAGTMSYFWLNSLESLLNAFVELDPTTQQRLATLDGLVVRVKTFAPYQVFYLLFTIQGIEVTPQPQGEIQARLSGRLRDLVWTLLGLESEQRAEAKGYLSLWGDQHTVMNLRQLLQEFNLRSAAGQWIRSHWPINMLWQKLSQQDLSWLQDLQPIPSLIRQTREELAALQTQVEQQQQQLHLLQQQMRQQLLYSRLLLAITTLILLSSSGFWLYHLLH